MSKELDILQLADDYEKVTYKDAQAYLIINKKRDCSICSSARHSSADITTLSVLSTTAPG